MSAVLEQTKIERELWHIAGTGDVEGLSHLLAQGPDVNAGDRTGVTALMRAAYHGQLPMVRALIEHGADVNATDRSGLTALMMAKHAGHQEIVDALLALGAHGPRPAKAKPRSVGPVVETSVDAQEHREVKVKKSPTVRTLHEPPEIWEMLHTAHATSAKADDTPSVRTLHEPQEILDAVHTTQSEPRFALAAVRRIKLPKPFIAGSALMICALTVFGWLYLRGGESSSPAPAQPQVRTINPKPISLPHQPPAAAKTTTAKSKRLTAPSTNKVNPKPPVEVLKGDFGSLAVTAAIENATSESAVKPAAASARKLEPKTQDKAAKPRARLRDQNDYVRKPHNSLSTQAETSVSLKKEADKPQTQQSTDPPKASSQPKPKVIQWP